MITDDIRRVIHEHAARGMGGPHQLGVHPDDLRDLWRNLISEQPLLAATDLAVMRIMGVEVVECGDAYRGHVEVLKP